MVAVAMEAAEQLAAAGIQARVLNMATLKPLDEEALERAARETGALVTLEEHSVIGGLGAAVCEAVAARCPVPVVRVGVEDQFGQSGPAKELLKHYGLTVDNAVEKARAAVALKR